MAFMRRCFVWKMLLWSVIFAIMSGCSLQQKQGPPQAFEKEWLTVYQINEKVPQYDITAEEKILLNAANAHYDALYCHSASYVGVPAIRDALDGKYIICLTPPEMKSGSKYQVYSLTQEGMALQENRYLQKVFFVEEEIYTPSLGYAICDDELFLTYDPYNSIDNRNVEFLHCYYDKHEKKAKALLLFSKKLGENEGGENVYSHYPLVVDLETGEETDFLQTVMKKEYIEGFRLVTAHQNQYLFDIDRSYYYYNDATEEIVAIDGITEETKSFFDDLGYRQASVIGNYDDGILFCAEVDGAKEFFWCDSIAGSILRIADYGGMEATACIKVKERIVCWSDNAVWSIDTITGEEMLLKQDIRIFDYGRGNHATFLLCSTENGAYYFYDFVSGKELCLSESSCLNGVDTNNLVVSPDGRKLIAYFVDSDNTIQFSVFDMDKRQELHISRINGNEIFESRIYWRADNQVIVATEDNRESYIYILK